MKWIASFGNIMYQPYLDKIFNLVVEYLSRFSVCWKLCHATSAKLKLTHAKLKPGPVGWWNGPNQETEASICFFHFILFFRSIDITSLKISYFHCRDNSKMNLWYCCLMQNSYVLRLSCVLDIRSVLFR